MSLDTEPNAVAAAGEGGMDAGDLARMSGVLRHRLRNHVAGIKGAICLLQDELRESAPARLLEYFPLILNECRLMEDLTNRMGTLFEPPGNGEAGQALGPLLDMVRDELHREFPKVEFEFSVPAGLHKTSVPNGPALATTLREALRNAAEAAARERRVTLNCRTRPTAVDIEIRDGGKGMPEGDLDRAFQPFFTTKSKHIGIGLTIARRMMASCDGSIRLEQGQPSGMTVHVSTPLQAGTGS